MAMHESGQMYLEAIYVLLQKNEALAEQLYERHTVLTNMLMALGIDEETAIEDACRIEHVISEKSFAAVKEHYLNYKKVAFGNCKMPENRAFLHKENFFEQAIARDLRAIAYVIKNDE